MPVWGIWALFRDAILMLDWLNKASVRRTLQAVAALGAVTHETLGIHVKAAIQWQKISGGDWAACAAGISRRGQAQEQTRAGDQRADPLPGAWRSRSRRAAISR
jgi:hypothetical protein